MVDKFINVIDVVKKIFSFNITFEASKEERICHCLKLDRIPQSICRNPYRNTLAPMCVVKECDIFEWIR